MVDEAPELRLPLDELPGLDEYHARPPPGVAVRVPGGLHFLLNCLHLVFPKLVRDLSLHPLEHMDTELSLQLPNGTLGPQLRDAAQHVRGVHELRVVPQPEGALDEDYAPPPCELLQLPSLLAPFDGRRPGREESERSSPQPELAPRGSVIDRCRQ